MRTEWAFLAGLGVGAVATLMLAPRSGKDTQDLLAGKLRGGLDQVTSAGKKVRAQVKDLANRASPPSILHATVKDAGAVYRGRAPEVPEHLMGSRTHKVF